MKTTKILTSKNLIEIHENLNGFAKHHQNLGGQKAHKLIKDMWDESKQERDGSENELRDSGYDFAIKQVLSLLHKTFVP